MALFKCKLSVSKLKTELFSLAKLTIYYDLK